MPFVEIFAWAIPLAESDTSLPWSMKCLRAIPPTGNGNLSTGALRTIQHLTIHEGKFATNAKWRPLADPSAPKSKPTLLLPVRTAYIIEREEKGSDVNLASYLLLDAFKEEYELAVIVSNDFDLAEPIQLVRNEFGRQVCIVNPRKKIARGLQGIADHYMNVRFEMVKQAQFAPTLTDANGTFRKPDRWN